jgi:hypothetical protein
MKKLLRCEGLQTTLCAFAVGAFALVLNLPWSPLFTSVVESDSGVYAYIGSAIVRGQVPYRDIWTQKPPIGFYLDALAVRLMGQSPWAIWWLDLIWIALAAVLLLLVLRKILGLLPGFLASLIFVVGVMVPANFQGGNLMEIYGFVPQILVIAATYGFFATRRNRWVFLAGLFTGLAFMTKQTTIALGLAAVIAFLLMSLLWREGKALFLRLLFFALGFILPLGIATVYWSAVGALNTFVTGVFLYNLSYVGVGAPFLWSIKHTILSVFPQLFVSKLYAIACCAFLLYVTENAKPFFRLLSPRSGAHPDSNDDRIPPAELMMLVIFIALPVELMLTSLGGRNLGHYFLTLLPAVTTAIAYTLWKATAFVRGRQYQLRKVSTWLGVGSLLLVLGALLWSASALLQDAPSLSQLESFPRIFSGQYTLGDIEDYIVVNTKPNDPVLIWHVHLGIDFITNRRTPQRILFPAELFIPVDQAKGNLEEFLGQLEQTPPKLIVVQKVSSIGLPFVNVPVDQMCPHDACIPELAAAIKNPDIVAGLEEFRQYFLAHYALKIQIDDWLIYERLP